MRSKPSGRLRRLAAASSAEAFLVELPADVAGILIGPAGSRLAAIESETGKLFAFETKDGLPDDHLAVLAEGPASEIEPRALPVSAGDELDVRLEEVHLRHPEDAIARLDGYVIAVADAAAQVGETLRVRIERATRTVAYARLAQAQATEEPVEAGVVAEEGEEEALETLRKRTTRRGTRGGRGRKKPVAAAESTGEAEAEPDQPRKLRRCSGRRTARSPRRRRRRRRAAGREEAEAGRSRLQRRPRRRRTSRLQPRMPRRKLCPRPRTMEQRLLPTGVRLPRSERGAAREAVGAGRSPRRLGRPRPRMLERQRWPRSSRPRRPRSRQRVTAQRFRPTEKQPRRSERGAARAAAGAGASLLPRLLRQPSPRRARSSRSSRTSSNR